MDLSFRHDPWFRRLPSSPADEGRVELLVCRPAKGERALPESVRVTLDRGIEGDRWSADPERLEAAQVSLINVHVARALGGAELAPMTGDNLHVDLDLSEDNLPIGTRLVIGAAELEVSEKPHRGCRKFLERFGHLATKRISRATRVGKRGRGMLCRVARAGEIRVGDAIRVVR